MKNKVKAKIECFSHSTENLTKVINAIKNIIGFEYKEIKIKKLIGHWGNVIFYINILLEEKDADKFIKNLSKNLSEKEKNLLKANLNLYLNEQGKLYLRFDKQKAYKKQFKLALHDDIIKVIISPINFKDKNATEIYKELGLIK